MSNIIKIAAAANSLIGYCEALKPGDIVSEAFITRMQEHYVIRLKSAIDECADMDPDYEKSDYYSKIVPFGNKRAAMGKNGQNKPDREEKVTGWEHLSRDAQVIIYCVFPFGEKSSCAFMSPDHLSPRAKAAFQELVDGLFIEKKVDDRPPESWHFQGTKKLPSWRSVIPEPQNEEVFPLSIGNNQQP